MALMCRALTVSRSGYYDWRSRPPPERAQANARLMADIHRVYYGTQGACWRPAPHAAPAQRRPAVGKNRVARVMQAEQLRAKAACQYKAMTHSNHNLPVAPNLLEQDFTADVPNQKSVSDITYGAPSQRGPPVGG